MSDAKHSPLKWHLESGSFEYVLDTHGDTVCICENANDSELIVRAVNSHAEMLRALKAALHAADEVDGWQECEEGSSPKIAHQLIKQAIINAEKL